MNTMLKIQWVRIKSLAGEPCRIKPNLSGPVRVAGERAFNLEMRAAGLYEIDLKRDEEIVLFTGDHPPELTIRPTATRK